MTNCAIAPSRLVTVHPCSRMSGSQAVALKRVRSVALAPAMRVEYSCMNNAFA
jgi:hypothetical protein